MFLQKCKCVRMRMDTILQYLMKITGQQGCNLGKQLRGLRDCVECDLYRKKNKKKKKFENEINEIAMKYY